MYFNRDTKDEVLQNDNTNIENNEEKKENEDNEDVVVELASAPLNSEEYQNLSDGEYLTSNGYTLKIENGILEIC